MDGLVAVSNHLCRRAGAAPSRQRLAKTGRRVEGSLASVQRAGLCTGRGDPREKTANLMMLGYEPTRPCSDRHGAGRVRAQVLPDVAPTARTQQQVMGRLERTWKRSIVRVRLAIPVICSHAWDGREGAWKLPL